MFAQLPLLAAAAVAASQLAKHLTCAVVMRHQATSLTSRLPFTCPLELVGR